MKQNKIFTYYEGYNCGLNWTDNYKPGGPWVYGGKNKELAESSLAENKAWLEGWEDGYSDKTKNEKGDA